MAAQKSPFIAAPFQSLLSNAGRRFKHPILAHPDLAHSLVAKMRPADFHNKVVLSTNPGVGAISHALVSNPEYRPRRILLFEPDGRLHDAIHTHTASVARQHGTDFVLQSHDFMFDGFFTDVRSLPTLLGHPDGSGKPCPSYQRPWHDDSLVTLVSTLSVKFGDLNLTHLFRWISQRAGIHEFGRAPMYVFVPRTFSQRVTAKPGDSNRGRLGVLAQAITDIEVLDCRPVKEFYNFKTEIDLLRFEPKLQLPFSQCTYEEFEFVIRTLFVQKRAPLKDIIRSLDPTKTSLAALLPQSWLTSSLNSLTTEQLIELAEAFAGWPLKMEFHGDHLVSPSMPS